MKAPLIPRYLDSCRDHQREHGVTMVLVALAMIAIIAMAALSIDVVNLYLVKEEAQRAADAAALASARVISISGMTGDPTNSTASWQRICGGLTSAATQAAVAVASQNPVSGTSATAVVVTYSDGGAGVPDCSTLTAGGPFSVNPRVTVSVRRDGLPNFFSRIWGNTGNTVSATATAEAFNPSASDISGRTVTPVQPSCVKPWMVPNQDPYNPSSACNIGTNPLCLPFVSVVDGSIQHPGISPANPIGVIGETFTLFADCLPGTPCARATLQPKANVAAGTVTGSPGPPNLEYLPGEAPASAVAVPACAASGGGGNPFYAPAVAGCDQTTAYQCGVPSSSASTPNLIDLAENPGGPPPAGDTASAIACLLTNDPTTAPLVGQDSLDHTVYPYKITAGSVNPNSSLQGKQVSSSTSIMSFPIYDTTNPLIFTGTRANVTIVGFLQVFINDVNPDGSLNVTVLNVSGCGNSATNAAIPGTSPVPVRLVTPP